MNVDAGFSYTVGLLNNQSSVTLPLPAGAAVGDILLIFQTWATGVGANGPGQSWDGAVLGWGSDHQTHAYAKVATADDLNAYTAGFASPTSGVVVYARAVRDPASPPAQKGVVDAGQTFSDTAPIVSADRAGRRVLRLWTGLGSGILSAVPKVLEHASNGFVLHLGQEESEGPGAVGTALGTGASHAGTFVIESNVPPVVESRFDRVRSSVSEDAGSILEATNLIPVESAVSEAFLPDVSLSLGELYGFSELLTPDEISARYYPLPTNNTEYLSTVRGETKLGRMARVYPSRVMSRVADIPEFSGLTQITGQQAVSYMFSKWAAEFGWFTYEPVPDLRFPNADPESPGGVLYLEALFLPQGTDSRRTMRDVVDEWLSIFPGTILRQNAAGNIELVPRIGPDAPTESKSLSWLDLYDLSEGKPDPKGVINRATVRSRGWKFIPDQEVSPPAFFVETGFTEDALLRIRVRSAVAEGATTLPVAELPEGIPEQYVLTFSADSSPRKVVTTAAAAQKAVNLQVQPLPGALAPGDFADFTPDDRERVRDGQLWRFGTEEEPVLVGGDKLEVQIHTRAYEGADGDFYGHDLELPYNETETITLQRDTPYNWTFYNTDGVPDPGQGLTIRFTFRSEGIEVYVLGIISGGGSGSQKSLYGYRLDLNAFGLKLGQSNVEATARFGYSADDVILRDESLGGGNLVTISTDEYGEREETISSNVFALTAEQCKQVAEAFVRANIEPRIVREAEQSVWNAFPVKFEDIGRFADLPNGERLLVQNRSYADAYTFEGGAVSSTFSGVVLKQLIDTTSCFLYLDDGSYFQLDDSSVVEDVCEGLYPQTNGGSGSGTGTGGGTGTGDASSTFRAVETDFSVQQLTLKNGVPVTGDTLTAYQGIFKFFDNDLEYGGNSPVNLTGFLASQDGYFAARVSRMYDTSLDYVLLTTGDRRALDRLKRNADGFYSAFRSGWNSTDLVSPPASGPSPFKNLYVRQGQPSSTIGTDTDQGNEVKMVARALQLAHLFDVNRDLESPAGYDYAAEADRWKALLREHIIPKWFGPEGGPYYAPLERGSEQSRPGWAAKYEGRQNTSATAFDRADAPNPILFRRNAVHTEHTAGLMIPQLMQKVFPGGEFGTQAQWQAEYDMVRTTFLQQEYFDVATPYGTGALIARGLKSWGNAFQYLLPTVYAAYALNDLIDLWITTGDAGFRALLPKLAKSVSAFVFDNGATDIAGDIGGGVTRTSLDGTRSLPPATSNSSSFGRRIKFHGIYYVYPTMMLFDTTDDHIEATTKTILASYGGLANPKVPHVGAGMILKFARNNGLF